jgi:hypothetical protein
VRPGSEAARASSTATAGDGCLRCARAPDRVRRIAGGVVATCVRCRREWLRLPLFAVSGATGVGKTTSTEPLPQMLEHCVRLDADVLWRHDYMQDQEATARFYRRWLRLAIELHQSGRPLVLSGNAWPSRWDTLPERTYVSAIHHLVLVCDPAVHERRLRTRGYGSMDEYYFPHVLRHNEWLREHAPRKPDVVVVDTTTLAPAETTATIAEWVRGRLP